MLPCSLHDVQNSFWWSMQSYFNDPDFLRDCHIGIASCLNSSELLVKHLGEWLLIVLRPVAPLDACESLKWQAVWKAVGVTDAQFTILCTYQLRFENGFLLICEGLHNMSDIARQCLLALWKLLHFKSSRWLNVGHCSQAMVLGSLTGLYVFYG